MVFNSLKSRFPDAFYINASSSLTLSFLVMRLLLAYENNTLQRSKQYQQHKIHLLPSLEAEYHTSYPPMPRIRRRCTKSKCLSRAIHTIITISTIHTASLKLTTYTLNILNRRIVSQPQRQQPPHSLCTNRVSVAPFNRC